MRAIADERRRRGFERFLLFTDAVMAIAVTLLILPVVDEILALESRDMNVLEILGELRGELFGFLLGFMVVMLLWLAHQQVFSIIAYANAWLIRLNVLWLLSITLLPFTTALIADHADEQATVLLYVGNVALSIYCLGASTWVLSRSPDLLLPEASITADERHDAILNSSLITIVFILALLLPGLGFAVMLLLFLVEPLKRLWARRGVSRAPIPSP
jgi:uncharacterized membrane protein